MEPGAHRNSSKKPTDFLACSRGGRSAVGVTSFTVSVLEVGSAMVAIFIKWTGIQKGGGKLDISRYQIGFESKNEGEFFGREIALVKFYMQKKYDARG